MIDFSAALNPEAEAEHHAPAFERGVTPLDRAKHVLMQFRSAIQAMNAEVSELEVLDGDSERRGAEMTAQARGLLKQIEEKQKQIIEEPQRFVKAVQNFTLPFRKDLDAIIAQVKRKLEAFGYQKELERREAEKRAQEEAARLQKEMDRRAKKAGIEPVTVVVPVLPDKREPVRTETGTTSYVAAWDYEVINASQVPARYLIPDPTNRAAVMESIRAGVREIPGLRIFERMQARTRI
jgi:hypothetical protein